jgi:glycopeptide antibiotics resistance protein
MENQNLDSSQHPPARSWSNRILAASLFGILFFTLFPYWVDLSRKPFGGRSPFLLGRSLHFDGILHTFLNTLLFVPFGFALSGYSIGRGKSRLKSLAVALVAGAILSYAIEFTQIYIPSRDSAWDDVLANTLGSVMGMLLGVCKGRFISCRFSEWEIQIEEWFSVQRIAIVALAYLGIWLVISIPLQQMTRLNNWDPNSYLSVGNDSRGDLPWNGRILRIQVWDRALAARLATGSMDGADSGPEQNSDLLATYDPSHPPPLGDQTRSLPNLVLKQAALSPNSPKPPEKPGNRWLISEAPVVALSEAVRKSNQFAVLLDCIPNRGSEGEGSLIAISSLAGKTNFAMRQEGSSLIIVLRNGLDFKRTALEWPVANVFAAHEKRSIVFSYDGARGSLYIDGKKERSSYYLSPGAGLVHELVRIKTAELVAYSVLYDALIFIPIGILLGIASRKTSPRENLVRFFLLVGVLLPTVVLEVLLIWISGRQPSIAQMVLTLSLTVAGLLWMSLDPPALSI